MHGHLGIFECLVQCLVPFEFSTFCMPFMPYDSAFGVTGIKVKRAFLSALGRGVRNKILLLH